MITSTAIIARMRASLDAQPNTGYYNDTDDIIPAIDSAVKWVMAAINAAKAQEKKITELLRESQFCRIYLTNIQSRIMIDGDIWTIDAVQPLPISDSNGQPTPPTPSQFESLVRTDLVFRYSNYSAARKTIEESGENRQNPFSPGYMPPAISSSLLVEGSDQNVDFAYIDAYSYNSQQTTTIDQRGYIEIQPSIPRKLVAVFVTIRPGDVTASGQNIPLPMPLFTMVVEKALNFVSYEQGDKTTLWQVTEADIAKLISFVS